MKIVRCERQRHGEAIRSIFNEAIASSTALYEYAPRSPQRIEEWFAAKAQGHFPVIGLETEAGELAGFASYGTFRAFPGYKYTIEHTVYVEARFRRQGCGRILLREIIAVAQAQDYHLMIGVIDATNLASIALHESFGFTPGGVLREAGFKFGRWLDVAFYQLTLPTPAAPADG
ncbi:MAG TPA: GNAT family N-acetyltransferase [Verrucomicrobiae bacterium]|jgi:phosphinothricin acetyltransferase|nr:GNAT family N-acetyltransferase [Verrucomicrobiae bacterium]